MVGLGVGRAANQKKSHWFFTRVSQSVGVVQGNKNSISRADRGSFVADCHSARTAENVIYLFRFLMEMPFHTGARRQYLFSQAAQLNWRCRAINEGANLRSVWRMYFFGSLSVYYQHSVFN